jgi:hypothetical protein
MLILTYVSGDALGCINLEKTKMILFMELRSKTIELSIDDVSHYFPLTSIFTSIGEYGKDVSTDIEEIVKFEQENDLTNGMYKTTLPQLIMLYIAKQPKTDFFSFIKKEYIEYKNARVEEAINSLPD